MTNNRTHKCTACGTAIKHTYTWDDEIYGKECWKKIALPQLEKRREQKREQRKHTEKQRNQALVTALKQKDYSRIRSQFKKDFLASIIEQFEEKGFISNKQKQMIYGTGQWNGRFHDSGMLNDTDKINELVALYETDNEELKIEGASTLQAIYNHKEKAQKVIHNAQKKGLLQQ